jgi:DmsE family decaheme c-type cytochrome
MKNHTCSVVLASNLPTKDRISARTHLIARLAPLAMVGALLAFASPAAAQPPTSVDQVAAALAGSQTTAVPVQDRAQDAADAALRRFAGEVGLDRPRSPHGAAAADTQDEAYSALLDFAQMVGADAPKTVAADAAPTTVAPAKPKAAAAKPAKPKVAQENKGGEGDAYFVGSAKCLTCHAPLAAEFEQTLMGRIGKTTRKGTMECENCHGAGSKHVAAGGGRGVGNMMSFRPDDPRFSVQEVNDTCLTCHEKGDRTYWRGSTHETRGLACTNCHTVMRRVSAKFQLAKAVEMEVCFQCHKDRRMQLYRTSHMPLREGKVTCADCHQPHGTANEAMLRENSVNDNCYKCHAEKRGPFLFEHLPVRESCLSCHEPHGSVNESLLKMSRPRLCFECHGFGHTPVGGTATYTQFGRACMNCHNEIHGTNSPSGALLHR